MKIKMFFAVIMLFSIHFSYMHGSTDSINLADHNSNILVSKTLNQCIVPDLIKQQQELCADAIKKNDYVRCENAIEILKKLNVQSLEYGAACNYICDYHDKDGRTLLHEAAKNNSEKMVELLITSGINVNVRRIDSGSTPLHTAAHCNSVKAVQCLIKYGANVNAQNNAGMTPLHGAALINTEEQYLCEPIASIRCLIEHHANLNIQDDEGNTPLHMAANSTMFLIAQFLLEHGASVHMQNNDGLTPLDIASSVYNTRDVSLKLCYDVMCLLKRAKNNSTESSIAKHLDNLGWTLGRFFISDTKITNYDTSYSYA